MSIFVLDSSVAVKWVLQEAGTPKALALRDDILRKIHEVIAPDVSLMIEHIRLGKVFDGLRHVVSSLGILLGL